jgi:hypothetical protein
VRISDRRTGDSVATPRPIFAREADMLAPLMTGLQVVLPTGPNTPFFEVQSMQGVADVVLASMQETEIARRRELRLPALTSLTHLSVVRELSRMSVSGFHDTTSTAQISSATTTTEGHLRANVLPQLVREGWLLAVGNGWRLACEYVSPVNSMVAVELKRGNWRNALMQATSYTEFADSSYVALPEDHLPRSLPDAAFSFAGVGLLQVSPRDIRNPVRRVLTARRRRPRGLAHDIVAERVLNLHQQGLNSGPVFDVFGRTLISTVGPDLRVAVTC